MRRAPISSYFPRPSSSLLTGARPAAARGGVGEAGVARGLGLALLLPTGVSLMADLHETLSLTLEHVAGAGLVLPVEVKVGFLLGGWWCL